MNPIKSSIVLYEGKLARIIAVPEKGVNLVLLESNQKIETMILDKITPAPITKSFLESLGFKLEETIPGKLWEYISPDRRIILRNDQEYLNSYNSWYIHIDNEDMETIATCEISWIHQLQNLFETCEYRAINI
jgi:hypothetical protein